MVNISAKSSYSKRKELIETWTWARSSTNSDTNRIQCSIIIGNNTHLGKLEADVGGCWS